MAELNMAVCTRWRCGLFVPAFLSGDKKAHQKSATFHSQTFRLSKKPLQILYETQQNIKLKSLSLIFLYLMFLLLLMSYSTKCGLK